MIVTVANVDLSKLDRFIADTRERARQLRPVFSELRKPMRLDQRDHAKEQAGPDGKWPARAAVTEERRLRRSRARRRGKAARLIAIGPLRRNSAKRLLARLPGSDRMIVGDLFLRQQSRVPWSEAHQAGDNVGHGGRVRLPRRVYKWMSERFLDLVVDSILRHVTKEQ